MAGLHAGLSMLDAARWGCVAGSIMAEWQGVPPSDVLWGPLLQQAVAKQAQLQAAGFEASAFPQDWAADEAPGGSRSGCSSSDAAVTHAGGVVQVAGAAEAVPAASSSSGSAVRSLRVRQHSGGALLSCPSNARVQQRQNSRCFGRSVAPSSTRRPQLLGLARTKFAVGSGVHQRVCVRL
jgi:hypothetical protein